MPMNAAPAVPPIVPLEFLDYPVTFKLLWSFIVTFLAKSSTERPIRDELPLNSIFPVTLKVTSQGSPFFVTHFSVALLNTRLLYGLSYTKSYRTLSFKLLM